MLEPTARCLESGSLRRLLSRPLEPLKSHRMVHLSLWNCGAAGIEPFPLHDSLFHGTSIIDEEREKNLKHRVDVSLELLLDFLYPPRAVKYPIQCSFKRSNRQESQRMRAEFSGLHKRFYTSLVNEPNKALIAEADREILDAGETRSTDAESTCEDPYVLLEGILNSKRTDDYEEAWRLYELCDGKHCLRASRQLLAYLSTSHRTLDAVRCVHIFQDIRETARLDDFQNAIQAHLVLGDLPQAMKLHQEVLSERSIPVGSNILLAHLVDTSQWHLACTVWVNSRDYNSTLYSIWDSVVRLPNISKKIFELDAFVDNELAKPGITPTSDICEFASMVLESVAIEKAHIKGAKYPEVIAFVKRLERWMTNAPSRYERFIGQLVSRGQGRLAVHFYRRSRWENSGQLNSGLLERLLKLFCQYHSVLGIKQVLEDYFRYYGSLSYFAYSACASEFARQGNVTVVKALFSGYWGEIKPNAGSRSIFRPRDVIPLLHVHSRRGELAEVVRIFDSIENDFEIKPDASCWNVLISAYGKVHDVDGALDAFQKMQESSTPPDAFTFGTLMGIATTRGDFEKTLKLYNLAKNEGVHINTAMVDCLVLGHIQNNQLRQAETICEDALKMYLNKPRTRMWNSLLTAYALRRDLENVNRLLRRMEIAGVKYDSFTFSALMQAFTAVSQPDRAYAILKEAVPRAGLQVTAPHYAIVMGGYLATGQLQKVFEVHNRMIRRCIKESTSTRLMVLKARAKVVLMNSDPQDVQLANTEQYMHETYNASDVEDIVDPLKSGIGRLPLDMVHSVYFNFLMSVSGKLNAFDRVKKLYRQYYETVPENRKGEPPLGILTTIMASNLEGGDYDAAQECWEWAFQQAQRYGKPLDASDGSPVLYMHRYSLCKVISVQIASLVRQGRIAEIEGTIEELRAAGFFLDQKNWNVYVQFLIAARQFQQAFEICESILMPNWTGWARVRWTEPVRNRLPMGLRHLKRAKSFLKPEYYTLLYLARAYNDLRDSEAESLDAQLLVARLSRNCPRTLRALQTMYKTNDPMERKILGGQECIRVSYM